MADDRLITVIEIDAGPALQGISQFESGAARISTASQAATASVDRLGVSLDAVGAAGARAGHAFGNIGTSSSAFARDVQTGFTNAGASAAEYEKQRIAGAASVGRAFDELGGKFEQTIRKMQTGQFNAFDAQAALGSLSQIRQSASAGRIPQAGEIAAAPFERAAVATVATTAATVDQTLGAFHPSSELSRATRFVRQAEAGDPTVGADTAKIHQAEAAVAPTIVGQSAAQGLAFSAAGGAEEAAMIPVANRLSAALDRTAELQAGAAAATKIAPAEAPAGRVVSTAEQQSAVALSTPAEVASRVPATAPALPGLAAQSGIAAASIQETTAASEKLAATEAQTARALGVTGAASAAAVTAEKDLASATHATAAAAGRAAGAHASLAGEVEKGHAAFSATGGAAEELSHKTEKLGEAAGATRGEARRMHENFNVLRATFEGSIGPLEALRYAVFGVGREMGLFRVLLGPVGLALGAAGGAMYLLFSRANETETNLKSFGATLHATGGIGQTSAEDLQHLVERLKQTGLSAEEAKKTVDSVARAPGIAPGIYEQIALLGRNTAAVFGGDSSARAEQWAKAVAGGVEPTIKLASELNLGLSPAEIDTAISADRLGGSHRALLGLLAASAQHVGQARDTFTGLRDSFQELKNSWDALIDSLSKSPRITQATDAVSGAIRAAATPAGQDITLGASVGLLAGAVSPLLLRRLGVPISAVKGALLGAGSGAAIGGAANQGAGGIAEAALTGAGIGATIGSVVPVVGPAVGAGVGATVGATAAATQQYYNAPGPKPIVDEFGRVVDVIDYGAKETAKNTAASEKLAAAMGDGAAKIAGAIDKLPSLFGDFGARERQGYEGQVPHAALPGEVVPGQLLDALIAVESRGNQKAESSAGALGLTQIKLSTANDLRPGTTHDELLNDPELNRQLGSRYLAQMVQQFGTLRLGLEAYNAGPGTVQKFIAGAAPEPSVGYANTILQKGGYSGAETPEQLGLTTPKATEVTPEQKLALANLTADDKEHLDILQRSVGATREFQLGYQHIVTEARGITDESLRNQTITEKTSTLIKELSQQYNDQSANAARTADQTERSKNAYRDAGLAAGQAAEAQAAAENQFREHGGPGVAPYRQQLLQQQAGEALKAGYQQLAAAEPAIAAQRDLAEAALQGRNAEDQVKVAIDAHAFAQEALIRAQNLGVRATQADAAALEQKKVAQLADTAALEHAKTLAESTQRSREANAATRFEIGLQGQDLPTEQSRAQTDLFRAQQDIAAGHRTGLGADAAAQQERAEQAYLAEVKAAGDLNIQLADTDRQTQRINTAFEGIASTVDGELTNSIRNALIRTPAEAGEHLKHFWDDFRAGLKSTVADIESSLASALFIKPLTGTAAGALGLGQVAQQYGTFGGLFTGGGAPTAGAAQGAAGPAISGSQLALNVSGLSSGASVFGATQGGNVFASGNTVSVQSPDQTSAGEAVAATTGTAGLSADQIQALRDAGTTPLAAPSQTSSAAPTEAFLGAITSAVEQTALPSPAASAQAGATSPEVFLIPGTETPISGASSLAPQQTPPGAPALTTGASTASATPATAPATSSLNAGTLAGAASAAGSLGSLLSQPGLLPSFLSGTSGAGGLFGAGGITATINNFGASTGLFASAGTSGVNALSGADLADLGVPGASAGLFGGSATLGSALTGAGAGLGAGVLLNSLIGGNQVTGTIGSGAGALLGATLGSFVPGIGTLLGGLVGGAGGGALGGLLGAPPKGQSAGAVINSSGQIAYNDTGGSAANIQSSDQVSSQISSFVVAVNQLTNAAGQKIGNIPGGEVVASTNNTQGIQVTSNISGVSGGDFGQNAANAVTQTELQIVKSLTNVSGSLQTILQNINDPSQLQAAVQFADVYDKLNVTSAQLTASLSGNTDAIGPFSQALTTINSTFAQLTSQAQQFGVAVPPITAALNAVMATLNQDFAVNLAEGLSTAIDGGNDFLAKLIQIHQAFVQNTNDAQALATGVPTGTAPGFAAGTASGQGTPSGWILVGEQGPEWMFQPGGATVLPNGVLPSEAPDPLGRSFADGTDNTIGVGDVAGQVPGIGSAISQAAGGPSLLSAVGGAAGISTDALSTIGDVVPIAGPIIGGLIGVATGGNLVSSALGAAASLIGFAVGGPIGGVIGSLVGLVGNLFGPPPSNDASGDLVDLASGAISGFQSAGNKNADTAVQQISSAISAISTTFQQATGGTISGAVNVQDGTRDGIKTSYAGPLGNINAKWGSVSDAIGQFALAIAHDLVGVDPALQAQLAGISDPNQLIPTIEQFTGKSIDLSTATVTGPASSNTSSAPAAAAPAVPPPPPTLQQTYDSIVGANPSDFNNDAGLQNKVNLVSLLTAYAGLSADEAAKYDAVVSSDPGTWNNTPAGIQNKLNLVGLEAGNFAPDLSPDLTNLNAQYNALPAYASGTTSTPPGWILVGEQGPEWINQAGGATVLPNGMLPPDATSPAGRSFADGTDTTATAAATAAAPAASEQITSAIVGTEAAQAGPVLAALGIDQLQVVIQNLATSAPEIAQMAQNLINSGNALPDILTQGIQALTDPLDAAIAQEKAAGQERVDIATQTGQDLVKVEQLNSANLIQAVTSNLSPTALNGLLYSGNTQALETLQASPALAGLSGQQLSALVADIGGVAPDLAALAQQFISSGTALPDANTQALEAIVNPLKLAIQQQTAQSEGRNQIQEATGQDPATVAALNTASTVQAILQQISNPAALQALVTNGSPQGLTALQAGPAIAGLGVDQLQALSAGIGATAPELTDMISSLISSGRALPDALTQATEAITQAGLLAVQKAAALAFEQVQAAGPAGQNVGEAQQLGSAEVAQATAQATGTEIPLGPLPDWIGQLEEAANAPLQLAIQKQQAAGLQQVQIAETTGASLVQVQQENADAIEQIWYQATQQLTSLKNDITTGSLSGLTAANQVTASIEQFNQVLTLVQGGNTNFLDELATAGQAAVQAAQTAYGNGPQTASVRQQVLEATSPFLVSASGYPTDQATSVVGAAGSTTGTSSTATGTTTDLQANTTALQNLTSAISGTSTGGAASGSSASVSAAAPASGATTAAAGTSGFSPDLTASLDNLYALYNALSPAMQAIYNGVVGGDNTTYNNAAGLGNKVDLAALLSGYQGLSPSASSQYDTTVSGDSGTYNNTGAGVSNKLSLVESLYPAATTSSPAAATSTVPAIASTSGASTAALTTNPVTGQSFSGSGITAVTPNFPAYPSASTLSNALSDAIAGNATSSDYLSINQAVQAGILNAANQPGYALVIQQAQQWAAGQSTNPSGPLAQALSDALNGTPTLQEWALIIQAVNAGIINPSANPQYATVVQEARVVANAQATSLSSIPDPQTAYNTTINGLPAFAGGTAGTPPGAILVGERGPEMYQAANDNSWTQVGASGPEILNQAGGATILPFPNLPRGRNFADGTPGWTAAAANYSNASASTPDAATSAAHDKKLDAMVSELQALRKQMLGGQMDASQKASIGNAHLGQISKNIGPNISAPARRAVG